MTDSEFREIKNKIEILKQRSTESKAKISVIESQWQSEYGFSDLQSAKEKLEALKSDAEIKKQRKESLMKKLETSFDWDKLY